MSNSGKDTKHTRHIYRRIYLGTNGDKWKMHKIVWFEWGLQLEEITTKNVEENGLKTSMKYIMGVLTTDL